MIRTIVLVCVFLMTCSALLAQDADTMSTAELRRALAEANTRIAQLEKENAALRARLADQQQETQTLEQKVTELDTVRQTLEQEKQAEQARVRQQYFTRAFDANTNRTQATGKRTDMRVTRGSRANHMMQLNFSHAGQAASQPVASLSMRVEAFFAGGVYRRMDTVEFEIDGKIAVCRVSGYSNRPRMTGGSNNKTRKDDEFFTITVPRELAERIGGAREVRLTMKRVRSELTREQIEMFAAAALMMSGE